MLDIDSHDVHFYNVEINLTALEFKLLRQLVDTRGREFSLETNYF